MAEYASNPAADGSSSVARHLTSQSKQNCLRLKEPCFTHLLRNKRLELSCTSCNESVRRLCLPCPSPFAFARPSLLGRCIWQADTAASQPASQQVGRQVRVLRRIYYAPKFGDVVCFSCFLPYPLWRYRQCFLVTSPPPRLQTRHG